jgi:tRNA(Ile)-lysidine synthase TilS/MesJ
MPKVMFDRTVKVKGIKFRPNIPVEVSDEVAKEVVANGGWVFVETPVAEDEKEIAEEIVETVEELMEATKAELEEIAKDLKIPSAKAKKKSELAEEIAKKTNE